MTASPPPLVVVPVKPFSAALSRLSTILDQDRRAELARALAERSLAAARHAGLEAVVVSNDQEVRNWVQEQGMAIVEEEERRPPGVDRAAAAGSAYAAMRERPWIVLHADLPLIGPADLDRLASSLAHRGSVIAPSYDGGTAALGGSGPRFPFAYGPGSFRRHLAVCAADDPPIVFRPGLALDIDRPEDFHLARALGAL